MPRDDRLIAELSVPRYFYTSAGKLRVESKDDLRRRGVRSPDRADAFCLTFAVADTKRRRRAPIVYPDDHVSHRLV